MRALTAILAVAIAALPLTSCGDDETTTAASSAPTTTSTSTNQSGPPITNTTGEDVPSTVQLAADPDGALAYDTDELTVAAGQPTIEFTNDSGIDHDVAVEDANGNVIGKSEVIRSGSSEASFSAESDVYTYFCTVDAHREAGMEGTLTLVDN
jgi:plastocyanin